MKTINGYILDNQKALLTTEKVRENPRRTGDYPRAKNVHVFCDELPKFKEYEIAVLSEDDKTWEIKADYRNVVFYSKENGEPQELIKDVGTKPDFNLYTLKPKMDNFQKFDDKKDAWIADIEAKETAEKESAKRVILQQLDALDLKKIRYLVEKESGDLSGKKYFDEYEKGTVKLRKELKELNNE